MYISPLVNDMECYPKQIWFMQMENKLYKIYNRQNLNFLNYALKYLHLYNFYTFQLSY